MRRLLDRVADKLGYERKRPRISGQFLFRTSSGPLWRLDVELDSNE